MQFQQQTSFPAGPSLPLLASTTGNGVGIGGDFISCGGSEPSTNTSNPESRNSALDVMSDPCAIIAKSYSPEGSVMQETDLCRSTVVRSLKQRLRILEAGHMGDEAHAKMLELRAKQKAAKRGERLHERDIDVT
jgi:hypothetical protein